MIMKVFIGLMIAFILVIGVFGLVKTTHAQESPETLLNANESASNPEPQTFEYEYMVQNGSVNSDVDVVQTQSRTRLFEMQDGECDADCDPQQVREQIGINNEGVRQQERINLGEFDCTGDCVPQQQRLSDGIYGYGVQRQSNTSMSSACDGTGILQGAGQAGNGK